MSASGSAGAAEVEVPHLGPEEDLQVADDERDALHGEEEFGDGGELVRGGGLGEAHVVPGDLRGGIIGRAVDVSGRGDD